jgi:hypothetical protein
MPLFLLILILCAGAIIWLLTRKGRKAQKNAIRFVQEKQWEPDYWLVCMKHQHLIIERRSQAVAIVDWNGVEVLNFDERIAIELTELFRGGSHYMRLDLYVYKDRNPLRQFLIGSETQAKEASFILRECFRLK